VVDTTYVQIESGAVKGRKYITVSVLSQSFEERVVGWVSTFLLLVLLLVLVVSISQYFHLAVAAPPSTKCVGTPTIIPPSFPFPFPFPFPFLTTVLW
jgi:hypothetical protein